MCGIAGFTAPGASGDAILRRMIGRMLHRGPDGQGYFHDATLALGHARLAVVDPVGGAQPRVDAASGDALVFNGEIYGYRGLAESLRARGVPLADHSDTEVLFWLLRLDGIEATLGQIDGMFAFAYRDGATGTLHLARDALGEKPLFYAQDQSGALLFASEPKALLAHPALADARPDPATLRAFLTYDDVPAPATGITGISKLPPGHRLVFSGGAAQVSRWHTLPFAAPPRPAPSLREATGRLDEALQRSVADRLIADVPVGVLLSGGVDSSLIAAIAAKQAPDLRAFTIRFEQASYDESSHAAQVGHALGLRHEIVPASGADVLDAWHTMDALNDEPFADPSLLPTALVCRAARRHVTVALGGDGADELFAGYSPFLLRRLAPAMSALPRATAAMLGALLDRVPEGDGYMALAFKLRQLCHGLGQPSDEQPFLWMAAVPPPGHAALLTPEAMQASGVDPLAPLRAAIAECPLPGGLEKLQAAFLRLYLPDGILTKVDRASMAVSLEMRSPLLAREVVAQALALPAHYKLHGNTTKYVLKQVARRYLPDGIVDRPKHGFALPVAAMLRGPLRAVLWDTLLSPASPLAPWFHRPALERLLGEHDRRERDHRKTLWALLCLFRFAHGLDRMRDRSAAETA